MIIGVIVLAGQLLLVFRVPKVQAAPAQLLVEAMPVRDGVLVVWSGQYPKVVVVRLRTGDYDRFVDYVEQKATAADCDGQVGDRYLVQAWADNGTTLLAQGESTEAQWRMLLVGVGR